MSSMKIFRLWKVTVINKSLKLCVGDRGFRVPWFIIGYVDSWAENNAENPKYDIRICTKPVTLMQWIRGEW